MKFKGNLWIYQSDDLDLENKKKLYFWIDKRKQWIVDVGKEKTTIFVQNTCNDWIDLQMSEFIQKMNGFEHLPNEEKLKNKDYLKLKSKYDSLNDISDKCNDLILTIKRKAPVAIKNVIKSVNNFYSNDIDGFEQEIKLFSQCTSTKDFKEGIKAFLEKREPNFD